MYTVRDELERLVDRRHRSIGDHSPHVAGWASARWPWNRPHSSSTSPRCAKHVLGAGHGLHAAEELQLDHRSLSMSRPCTARSVPATLGSEDDARSSERRQGLAANLVPASSPGAVVDELRTRATAAEVALAVHADAVQLHVDRDLMHRVLANPIENAIRHAPGGSTVQVSAQAVAGGTELRVTDAGRGVPEPLRDQVFERFVSTGAEAPRTNRGLGRAFCKVAVEAHGGRIWVEDAAPGAAFCIRIADAV